jgi:hypothetical protein
MTRKKSRPIAEAAQKFNAGAGRGWVVWGPGERINTTTCSIRNHGAG